MSTQSYRNLENNDIYSQQVSSFIYKHNANILGLPINFINYLSYNSAIHVHNTTSANKFQTFIVFQFYIKTEQYQTC